MGGGGSRGDHAMGNKTPASPNAISSSQNSNQSRKKTRIDVKDVFNNDDDDDSANNSKKRKLVPIGKLLWNYFNISYIIFDAIVHFLLIFILILFRLRWREEKEERRSGRSKERERRKLEISGRKAEAYQISHRQNSYRQKRTIWISTWLGCYWQRKYLLLCLIFRNCKYQEDKSILKLFSVANGKTNTSLDKQEDYWIHWWARAYVSWFHLQ